MKQRHILVILIMLLTVSVLGCTGNSETRDAELVD